MNIIQGNFNKNINNLLSNKIEEIANELKTNIYVVAWKDGDEFGYSGGVVSDVMELREELCRAIHRTYEIETE